MSDKNPKKETPKKNDPPKKEEPPKVDNRAVKSGMVHCRVVGPAPMMTEEGVKEKGDVFQCSETRARSYGRLVEPAKPEAEDSE